jgi:hypothetical protein
MQGNFAETLHAFSALHADFAASISRIFGNAGGAALALPLLPRFGCTGRGAGGARAGDLPRSCIYS